MRPERGLRPDLQALRSSTCTRQALGSAHRGVEGRDGIVFQKGASGTGNQMDQERTAQSGWPASWEVVATGWACRRLLPWR